MLSRNADVAVLDLYWSNKFASNLDKALIAELGKTAGYTPLDLRQLHLYSVQELKDHLSSVDPKIIVNMMLLFSHNEKYVQMLVQKTIEELRLNKIDIRTFPLNQLSRFIHYVALYEPQEVKVFFNYVVTAFDSGYFKMTP